MYPIEKKKRAVELYIKYNLSVATVVNELGYADGSFRFKKKPPA